MRGGGGGGRPPPPPPPEMTCGFLIQRVFCTKKKLWFIGVEVEQESSAPPPKKNPGSAPESVGPCHGFFTDQFIYRRISGHFFLRK